MGKRLSKIYTKTGDSGETGLGDGSRVPKDNARIEAIGAVDELNSWIGLVIEDLAPHEPLTGLAEFLHRCQHWIFDLGGELSIPGYKLLDSTQAEQVEEKLDELNEELDPLENFILPGGSHLVAHLHVARSVCRRAERRVVALADDAEVNDAGLEFLNRLSDFLFVAARYCGKVTGVDEVLWDQDKR